MEKKWIKIGNGIIFDLEKVTYIEIVNTATGYKVYVGFNLEMSERVIKEFETFEKAETFMRKLYEIMTDDCEKLCLR